MGDLPLTWEAVLSRLWSTAPLPWTTQELRDAIPGVSPALLAAMRGRGLLRSARTAPMEWSLTDAGREAAWRLHAPPFTVEDMDLLKHALDGFVGLHTGDEIEAMHAKLRAHRAVLAGEGGDGA